MIHGLNVIHTFQAVWTHICIWVEKHPKYDQTDSKENQFLIFSAFKNFLRFPHIIKGSTTWVVLEFMCSQIPLPLEKKSIIQ